MREKPTKKWLAFVFVCGMLFVITMASALASSTPVAEIDGVEYDTVTDALAAVEDNTETLITMVDDSKEDITISASQNIILDLNGYTLKGTGSSSVISNNGTLTIKDSSGDNSGTITNGKATNGGGIYSTGSLTVEGGTISGNTATTNGGGVGVTGSGATFEMTGGIIEDNTVTLGGGLWITASADSATITGTEENIIIISDNIVKNGGGGIYSGCDDVYISYAEISRNTVTGTSTNVYYGAGIGVSSGSGTLELDHVTISDNTSNRTTGGLGICVQKLIVENCTITENTSKSGAGGVGVIGISTGSQMDYQIINSTISDNTGSTSGGLYIVDGSTKYPTYVALVDAVITGNTGTTAGGVNGAINMTGGALYGNTSSDGNSANDWLINKTVVTNLDLSVPAASEMDDDGTDFSNYLWVDSKNGLSLDNSLDSTTLGDIDKSTFYFTARELSYVAEITYNGTTTKYETITAAVNAAASMGDDVVIKLIADEKSSYTITEDVTIPENSSITINLNGCTISRKSAYYAVKISSGASLTLTGSGTVERISVQGDNLSILGDIEVGAVQLAEDAVITASENFAPEALTVILDDTVLENLNDISDTTDIVTLIVPADGEILSAALAGAITVSGANALVTVSIDSDGNVIAKAVSLNGIYVDGVDGNDDAGDGTYNNPVKTFAKAKELLEEAIENGDEPAGIYVINTITVNDTEEWSLDDITSSAGEVKLMRLSTFTGVLVTVGDNGSLTLSDITIDGQNYTADAPLVQVMGENAQLTIESGTVIENNVNPGNSYNETSATVTVVNGTLTMNGGTITGNTGGKGGGIALVAKDDNIAVFYLNAGTISENTADNGGGIVLYGNSILYMYGGNIVSNTAYNYGGGLCVWSGATAYIYGGNISDNQQITDGEVNTTTYGGGGIYVNDSDNYFGYGTVYLYNVEITENRHVRSAITYNAYYDGTIAVCNTGNIEIYVTDGAVIHDNSATGRDITLNKSDINETFVISPVMLGGGAYN